MSALETASRDRNRFLYTYRQWQHQFVAVTSASALPHCYRCCFFLRLQFFWLRIAAGHLWILVCTLTTRLLLSFVCHLGKLGSILCMRKQTHINKHWTSISNICVLCQSKSRSTYTYTTIPYVNLFTSVYFRSWKRKFQFQPPQFQWHLHRFQLFLKDKHILLMPTTIEICGGFRSIQSEPSCQLPLSRSNAALTMSNVWFHL